MNRKDIVKMKENIMSMEACGFMPLTLPKFGDIDLFVAADIKYIPQGKKVKLKMVRYTDDKFRVNDWLTFEPKDDEQEATLHEWAEDAVIMMYDYIAEFDQTVFFLVDRWGALLGGATFPYAAELCQVDVIFVNSSLYKHVEERLYEFCKIEPRPSLEVIAHRMKVLREYVGRIEDAYAQ